MKFRLFADEFAYVARYSSICFPSAFQFSFLPSKPCLFPLKAWNSFYTVENPNLLLFWLNSPRCGDCSFSARFVRSALMLDSYVAGEGVELTVTKESGVEEKIKEVQLRSRRA